GDPECSLLGRRDKPGRAQIDCQVHIRVILHTASRSAVTSRLETSKHINRGNGPSPHRVVGGRAPRAHPYSTLYTSERYLCLLSASGVLKTAPIRQPPLPDAASVRPVAQETFFQPPRGTSHPS